MTLPGTLTSRRPLGRYRVEYPTNDIPGFDYVGHYDDLEQAGEALLNTEGASDIYDTVEKRYIHAEEEIDCVSAAWESWWWSQRVWWAQLLHKLGLNDPRIVNWTVHKRTGREPLWWYVLRILGIVGI